MPKEQYMCQLCANHGQYNQPKKGHKLKCPNRHCTCSLCSLNTKRRVLDQLERQWRTKNGKQCKKMNNENACSSNTTTADETQLNAEPTRDADGLVVVEQSQEKARPSTTPLILRQMDDVVVYTEEMWSSTFHERLENMIGFQNKKVHRFQSIELLLEM
ncbi:hypothetical protein GPALN_016267 [Globodera pallida]|uniref:DM domain-containing protein n=1 Tax=Globodera pallida TaxID=36090 RepID=A0A183CA55_GLOPA|nr:hypothetical protein GPALN_016267 [Globodera pallida]